MAKENKTINPKNFLEKIKFFLTEPVKSSAEADARKKELIPYTLISLGIVVIFLILGMAIAPIKIVFDIIAYIAMFFVFVFGWCLFKSITLKKKFADLECSNCKTVIKYSPDFKIDVKNKSFSISDKKTQNSKAGIDIEVTGIETSSVSIGCKCQECGTEKQLNKIFTTVHCTMSQRGVSALTADLIIMEMKKTMQAAYDNGFANCSSDIKIKTNTTAAREVVKYFNEDGTAGKTPWGTVTKTKK